MQEGIMINRDEKCVFVANTMGEAEVMATWLEGESIDAQVMDVNTLGGLDGLTPLSPTGVGQRGVEVWVKDSADIERARTLIAEQQAELKAKADSRRDDATPVDVACEECGKTIQFTGAQRGSVQNCTACGAHVDVPGEDEDWSEAEAAGEGESV
jgi:Putative prokaryotic signal transducing protein